MMDSIVLRGTARILPDNINTDSIISSRRKRVTIDPDILKQYLFEDFETGFTEHLDKHAFLVAGKNFGCGSAMEVAVTVVLAAGIKCVLAQSFSRSYYRNAINNGLFPIVCNTKDIHEGDSLLVSSKQGILDVKNETQNQQVPTPDLSLMIMDILQAGGLTEYLSQHGDFPNPECNTGSVSFKGV